MSQTAQASPSDPTKSWASDDWHRVCIAVQERWPHISEQDIKALPCDRDAIVGFLREFTESSLDEIRAVVNEFAPDESLADQVAGIAEDVAEPVHAAFDRMQYEADEHPAAANGIVFVTGMALGILGTLAFLRSRPTP
ncbi:hypothetical protein LF1_38750 [Rubripirellula obstinata]|uniref:Uncharacterized protein n=1 Tax=Rubripirellula obstinata TaxID=406547 RepID=A0A5B1CJQ3_9BACT|nr:hypothetical protein [Rubripirellula obstinata]KAA1261328.1 hypothetical protein LF1_38750 [Rubripirellula obstinata]